MAKKTAKRTPPAGDKAGARKAKSAKRAAAEAKTAVRTQSKAEFVRKSHERVARGLLADESGTTWAVTVKIVGRRQVREMVLNAKTAPAAKRQARRYYYPEIVEEILGVREI